MAVILIQATNVIDTQTRTLLLVLIILAIMLIIAGAVIAILTFAYARKHPSSLAERKTASEQR
jgi:hypothetical protein